MLQNSVKSTILIHPSLAQISHHNSSRFFSIFTFIYAKINLKNFVDVYFLCTKNNR